MVRWIHFTERCGIGQQRMCLHGLGLVMAMGDDHPLSVADGIFHRLFYIRAYIATTITFIRYGNTQCHWAFKCDRFLGRQQAVATGRYGATKLLNFYTCEQKYESAIRACNRTFPQGADDRLLANRHSPVWPRNDPSPRLHDEHICVVAVSKDYGFTFHPGSASIPNPAVLLRARRRCRR